MGALLIEQNEKWAAGPRYLNMTVYHGSRNLIYTNILDLTRMRLAAFLL